MTKPSDTLRAHWRQSSSGNDAAFFDVETWDWIQGKGPGGGENWLKARPDPVNFSAGTDLRRSTLFPKPGSGTGFPLKHRLRDLMGHSYT